MSRPIGSTLFKTAVWGVFLALAYRGFFETLSEFDTNSLTEGAAASLACLKKGILLGCSQPAARTWDFPLLQYLPSLGTLSLGASPARAARILGYLSVLYFFGTLFLMRKELRPRSETAARVGVLLLLTSPFLRYATSSFGEMGAAFLTLLFVTRCAKEEAKVSPAAVIGTFVLAGITKDVAFPFLTLLGMIARPRWKQAGTLAIGSVLVLILNSGFNLFRFGSPGNAVNLNPLFQVKDLQTQLSFALAIWFSPSGGLMFFWTSFVVFLIWVGWIALKDSRPQDRNGLPWMGTWVILGGLTAGFSKWYSPLGFVAWGPRLILPWIPAVAFLLLKTYAPLLDQRMHAISKNQKLFWAVFTVLLLCALPQFTIMIQPDRLDAFFNGIPSCSERAVIQIDPETYYRCVDATLWNDRWTLGTLYFASFKPLFLPLTGAYALLLAGLWSGKPVLTGR